MPIKILFENRFGIAQEAGLMISSTEVDGELYEVLGVKDDICNNHDDLTRLELELNIDKREGYAIHPLTDEAGNYVWYHHPKRLVLCLARGIWG